MGQRNLRATEDGTIYEGAAEVTIPASPEVVYSAIADLGTHLAWNGSMQPEKVRLLTLDAPSGPAAVGTEFASTGRERSARFTDRSVVTEADASKVFEFVTESTRSPKRGPAADMTTVNRFEIVADGTGSRVTRRCRIVRLSKMPAIMRLAPLRAMALAEGRKQLRSS